MKARVVTRASHSARQQCCLIESESNKQPQIHRVVRGEHVEVYYKTYIYRIVLFDNSNLLDNITSTRITVMLALVCMSQW